MLALPAGLVLAAFAGLSDLLGSALVLSGHRSFRRWFDALLALGLGFVLAVALGELLPEALEVSQFNLLWAVAGFGTLLVISRLLKGSGLGLTLAGVVVCDFFDGFAVASAAALASAAGSGAAGSGGEEAAGWVLAGGLFPHNFLEGASIALLMLSAGLSRAKSWLVAVALAVASLLGGAAVVFALPEEVRAPVQAVAAGFLLYVVLMERLPQIVRNVSRSRATMHLGLAVAGLGLFFLLGAVLPDAHGHEVEASHAASSLHAN